MTELVKGTPRRVWFYKDIHGFSIESPKPLKPGMFIVHPLYKTNQMMNNAKIFRIKNINGNILSLVHVEMDHMVSVARYI